MLLDLLLFAVGLIGLYFGSEWLVDGAGRLAVSYGVSSFVVGLTVVAFGTSAPELLVGSLATLGGKGALAVGNVVGSNIANIALILSVAVLIRPFRVQPVQLIRDIPIMIGLSALVLGLALNERLDRGEGVLLLALFVVYLSHLALYSRRTPAARSPSESRILAARRGRDLLLTVGGSVALGLGAHLLVDSAVDIARGLGVTEVVVGLTLVAVGTSVPELAASIAAARRGEGQLVIGNVIGSNIFNASLILGFTAVLRPLPVQASILLVEGPAMVVLSALLLPLIHPGRELRRWHGASLLVLYIFFVGWVLR